MLSLAIDSTLRGCNVVSLKVGDLFYAGIICPRIGCVQHKACQPVPFELTEPMKEAMPCGTNISRLPAWALDAADISFHTVHYEE